MREYKVDEKVRLIRSLPDLLLQYGCEGVVQSVWFAPASAYEVEFKLVGITHCVRALLLPEQLQPVE